MERRKALVLSVVATLMVFALVGMATTLVKMTLDGDDRAMPAPVVTTADGSQSSALTATDALPAPLDPVVSYLDVYEVVPGSFAGGSPGAGLPSSGPGAASPASSPAAGGAAPAGSTATPVSPSPVLVTPTPSAPAPTTPTPPPPAPTTTVAPRPPGVPSDWPAGKPIPPMPAGCREPQLEDNGVWNCQH